MKSVLFLSPTQAKTRTLKALWDTGATNTCIPMELAESMGIPLRKETVMQLGTIDQLSRYCSLYLRFADGHYLFIRDGVAVPSSRNQLVVGMDVMKYGKTSIVANGQNGVHFIFEISETIFQNGVLQ
ncbi:MAG: retroviral-like aspartic protease family protein [Bacteroidaceae bacterium]|nr:retroviral-like aspartic protease family protein [Bacteroidaceae bacterium]